MTIRWGILGCGDVTEVKSGPGFQRARGSRLVAVMRRDAAKAADYARRHNVPRWYSDAQRLIDDPEVDAVYIATPPGAHLELALLVAAAGKPAYVEKPLARSFAECRRMIEAFDAARRKLFVAYYRRRLPRFVIAKELIDSGRLGDITAVNYQWCSPPPTNAAIWRLSAEQAGAGLFLDLGSHTLDLLDFLLGELSEVRGSAGNLAGLCEVEDAVAMTFRSPCGALGAAQWNFAASHRRDLIEITGRQARLVMTTFGNEPISLIGADAAQETFDRPNPAHVQQPLIQSIVDDLSGEGTCPSTGHTAARTSRVMDQALEAYYGGRDDDFWRRSESWPGRAPIARFPRPQ